MDRATLLARYRETRALSVGLCRPLAAEDYRIQSMPDVSPPWWNLGHTSWFFAKNILEPFGRQVAEDARLEYALNSYYESLGPRLARDHRGLGDPPPPPSEVYAFRRSVDERMESLLAELPAADLPRLAFLVETGIQHEQQHQGSSWSPRSSTSWARTSPPCASPTAASTRLPPRRRPLLCPHHAARGNAGVSAHRRCALPAAGPQNSSPFAAACTASATSKAAGAGTTRCRMHGAYLDDFTLADRLVTNGEYLEFMEAGGYSDPLLWLANGWARVPGTPAGRRRFLYWERAGRSGRRALAISGPWAVCATSTSPSRSRTSASTRPTPSPVSRRGAAASGPAPACHASANAGARRAPGRLPGSRRQLPRQRRPPSAAGAPGRALPASWRSSAATSGNGRPTTTSPIPATSPLPAP